MSQVPKRSVNRVQYLSKSNNVRSGTSRFLGFKVFWQGSALVKDMASSKLHCYFLCRFNAQTAWKITSVRAHVSRAVTGWESLTSAAVPSTISFPPLPCCKHLPKKPTWSLPSCTVSLCNKPCRTKQIAYVCQTLMDHMKPSYANIPAVFPDIV